MQDDRLAVAGRFTKTDVALYYCIVGEVFEMLPDLQRHLIGEP